MTTVNLYADGRLVDPTTPDMDDFMADMNASHVVTDAWLCRWATVDGHGSWNAPQLALLGIKWPPKKGWKYQVIGLRLTPTEVTRFEALSGRYEEVMSAKKEQPKEPTPLTFEDLVPNFKG